MFFLDIFTELFNTADDSKSTEQQRLLREANKSLLGEANQHVIKRPEVKEE